MGLYTARALSIAVLAITLLLGDQVQFIFDNMVAIIE
jgi:hypothetical protein